MDSDWYNTTHQIETFHMLNDQMQFMILITLISTLSLWVCLCDKPKQARIPLILLVVCVISIQLVGRI